MVCSLPPETVPTHQDVNHLDDSDTQSLLRAWTVLPKPCPLSPWILTELGGAGGLSIDGDPEAQRSQDAASVTRSPRQSPDVTSGFCHHSHPKRSSSTSAGLEGPGEPHSSEFEKRRL